MFVGSRFLYSGIVFKNSNSRKRNFKTRRRCPEFPKLKKKYWNSVTLKFHEHFPSLVAITVSFLVQVCCVFPFTCSVSPHNLLWSPNRMEYIHWLTLLSSEAWDGGTNGNEKLSKPSNAPLKCYDFERENDCENFDLWPLWYWPKGHDQVVDCGITTFRHWRHLVTMYIHE